MFGSCACAGSLSRAATLATVVMVAVGCGAFSEKPTAAPGGQSATTVPPAREGVIPDLPPPPTGCLEAQLELDLVDGEFHMSALGRIYCVKDGAEMVLVPEGEFMMGAKGPGHDNGASDRPSHRVNLPAFLIDRHEVTVRQFRRYCESTGAILPANQESDERCPIVNVTWNEASSYAAWAGKRLPTEAEWEKAARGLDGRAYAWGDDPPSAAKTNYGAGSRDESSGPGRPVPVGSYSIDTSPWGCLDMMGNVSEWCADWYSRDYYVSSGALTATDPQGPASGSARVVRGGDWLWSSDELSCTYRGSYDPRVQYSYLGFRTARSLK